MKSTCASAEVGLPQQTMGNFVETLSNLPIYI